jgi:hypothetical protein
MIKASIEDFLRKGEFGPIRLGDNLDRILELLGEPDGSLMDRKHKRPVIVAYGVIEFHFDPEQEYILWLIYADAFDELLGGPAIDLDPWILRGQISKDDVETALRSAAIPYSLTQPLDKSLSGLRTEGGVELGFGNAEDQETGWRGLCVISLAMPGRKKTAKQISVSISFEDYELIRKEARRQGIKIAKLCSQWLVEKANHLRGN